MAYILTGGPVLYVGYNYLHNKANADKSISARLTHHLYIGCSAHPRGSVVLCYAVCSSPFTQVRKAVGALKSRSTQTSTLFASRSTSHLPTISSENSSIAHSGSA